MTYGDYPNVIFDLMSILSKYKVITVTHRNIIVNDIGHFYLQKPKDKEQVENPLTRVKELFDLEECLYLETCNRVTYLLYCDVTITDDFLKTFFHSINPELEEKTLSNIKKFVSVYEGENAVEHIFQMASSMDSLVVGEREIFRQFRKSYDDSYEAGYTGDNLRLLNKATVATAKDIYHNTKIGEKPLSVVSLSINALLKTQVKPDSRVLLIGAGETNALVAKFLRKYNFSNIKIYNRSLHNAAELSQEIGAESFHIKDLSNTEGQFDIIFICTSANEVIIDKELYRKMLAGDTSRKTIIDLAVPRNVALDVVEENDVQHIDIEALRKLSEANLEFRKKEVKKAIPIINKNLSEFKKLFQRRQIEKAMSQVPGEIATIKEKAINSVYKKRIEQLDGSSKELLLEMMDYMEKKCISVPMKLATKDLQS